MSSSKEGWTQLWNPTQRGYEFRRKADSNPMIADGGLNGIPVEPCRRMVNEGLSETVFAVSGVGAPARLLAMQ
jgi:hypothetical protein